MKRFSMLFYAIIALVVIYLFIRILPIVLIVGLVIWMFFKIVKTVGSWKRERAGVITPMNDIEVDSNFDSNEFTNSKIIDVEYEDVE